MHCSRYLKTLKSDILSEEPLCYRVYFGSYHRGTNGKMVLDSIEREVCIDSEYHNSHHLNNQTYLACIDYIRQSDDKTIDGLADYMDYSQSQAMSVYHGLYALDLINNFNPTLGIIELNENNIMLWQKYKCSRFWKKYYNSDLIKTKFSKLGINYDELDEDSDLGD